MDEKTLVHLYIQSDARARINDIALSKACAQLGALIGRAPEELEMEFKVITKVQWNSINRDNPDSQIV